MGIAVKATVEEILMGLVFHHKQSGTLRFILGGENHACGTLIFMMLHTAAWAAQMLDCSRMSSVLRSVASAFSILLALVVCFGLLVLVSTTMVLSVGVA